jgi:hypothetical protein
MNRINIKSITLPKKVDSGIIIEIPLRKGMGFAYAKYVSFFEITKIQFDANCLKVYDYIVEEPLEDASILKGKDLLFGPLIINGRPAKRGRDKVKVIGYLPEDNDIFIPDFKDGPGIPIVEDESKIIRWWPIHQLDIKNHPSDYPYKLIKHLEQRGLNSQPNIQRRIEMEILRKQGKNPKDIIDFNDRASVMDYYLMINVPIYSTIPKEMRGKALPLNYKEVCSKEVINFVDSYGLD